MQDRVTKLGKWHGTAVAEARGRFFDPQNAAASQKGCQKMSANNRDTGRWTPAIPGTPVCYPNVSNNVSCNCPFKNVLRGSWRCGRGSDFENFLAAEARGSGFHTHAFAEAAAVIAEALRKPSRNLRFATSRFKRNLRHSSFVSFSWVMTISVPQNSPNWLNNLNRWTRRWTAQLLQDVQIQVSNKPVGGMTYCMIHLWRVSWY